MDYSQILIKYSLDSQDPSGANLGVGELAYSSISGKLFIGTGGGSFLHIGGKDLVDRLTKLESYNLSTVRAELTALTAKTTVNDEDILALQQALGLGVGGTPTFNDLTVTGNLTVNGTLTTVDTTTISLRDPVIALAADTSLADGMDRGINFKRYDEASGSVKTGFFGVDSTDGSFKYIPDATEAGNNVYEGAAGTIVAKNFIGEASSATKLATPIKIQFLNDVSGSIEKFDGSVGAEIALTVTASSEATSSSLVRRDASGGVKFGATSAASVRTGSLIASGAVEGAILAISGDATMQNVKLSANLESLTPGVSKIKGFVIHGGTF